MAAVIGAMAVTPLPGPSLALALGTSMADTRPIGRSRLRQARRHSRL